MSWLPNVCDKNNPASPWLTTPKKALDGMRKVIGKSDYKAWEGVNTGGLNGCYWIRILEQLPNGNLFIENLHDIGKIKTERVQATIKPDLVYPLLRGHDVQKWKAESSLYIILAQDPHTRIGISEAEMKHKYPKTYSYFKQFERAASTTFWISQVFRSLPILSGQCIMLDSTLSHHGKWFGEIWEQVFCLPLSISSIRSSFSPSIM